MNNGTQAEATDRTDDVASDATDAAKTEPVAEEEASKDVTASDETGKVDDATDAEDGSDAAASTIPFIIVAGPIVATEVPKTAGPMEMVATRPVMQTHALEGNQAQVNMEQPVVIDDAAVQDAAAQFTALTDQGEQPAQTAAPAAVSMEADEAAQQQAAVEIDPELADKAQVVQESANGPAQEAAEGNVDHAEQFAAQVVKEAKNLVRNQQTEEQGQTAPVGEEEAVVKDDAATIRPVEAKDNSAAAEEDRDPEQQVKTGEQKETTAAHQNTTGTAHVMDGGRVDFRMSGAQPLEAQQVAAPPEPPQMVMNRVVDQVRSVVTPDKTEFFVQLKPDHLGGLSIGLVAEDKGVVAKIMTSSQQVHNALQADMTQMVQMLRDKGINVVQMEVIYDQTANAMSQNQGDGRQQQFGQGHGRSHGRGADQLDGTVSMYDTLSSYEVLAEQGGSVEFSA